MGQISNLALSINRRCSKQRKFIDCKWIDVISLGGNDTGCELIKRSTATKKVEVQNIFLTNFSKAANECPGSFQNRGKLSFSSSKYFHIVKRRGWKCRQNRPYLKTNAKPSLI